MPIQGLTHVPGMFKKLGAIKKGEKDAQGVPHDLSYFRVTYMPGRTQKDIETAFQAAYGLTPTSINIRFAQEHVSDIWDANYECYKKGGLIAKAGEKESGPYWIFYRDPDDNEVLVRNGQPVGARGLDFASKPIDLTAPIYKNSKGEPVFLEPYGRLQVVIPEVAPIDVGYFEFMPGSPRDIRNISAELGAFEAIAKQYGKSICGVPFRLIRREEEVTKNIGGKLSKGKSWVVHIEAGGEWGQLAIAAIERLALPEIIDAESYDVPEDTDFPEEEFQAPEPPRLNAPQKVQTPAPESETKVEMVDPLGAEALNWVASKKVWNCDPKYARQEVMKMNLPNPMAKEAFKKVIMERS